MTIDRSIIIIYGMTLTSDLSLRENIKIHTEKQLKIIWQRTATRHEWGE